MSPLMKACQKGNVEAVKELLSASPSLGLCQVDNEHLKNLFFMLNEMFTMLNRMETALSTPQS